MSHILVCSAAGSAMIFTVVFLAGNTPGLLYMDDTYCAIHGALWIKQVCITARGSGRKIPGRSVSRRVGRAPSAAYGPPRAGALVCRESLSIETHLLVLY